jgi:hypothetical protein
VVKRSYIEKEVGIVDWRRSAGCKVVMYRTNDDSIIKSTGSFPLIAWWDALQLLLQGSD